MRGMEGTPKTTHLGLQSALPASPEEARLDYVPNPRAGALYCVRFAAPEFTSLCPVTGQPDFAHLVIDYAPGETIVEEGFPSDGFFVLMRGSVHVKAGRQARDAGHPLRTELRVLALHGWGRRLVEAAETWARERGCREMGSDSWIDNLDGRAAHVALGYEERMTAVHFRKML